MLPVINDVSFAQSMASKGVVWKTITPCAPWQGALYERLNKSIKHSLYKVMQRTVPSQEAMHTLLVEIKGSINSRPLTYQEERWEETPALRPIDFIQRDIIVAFPFESVTTEDQDSTYLPQTRLRFCRVAVKPKKLSRQVIYSRSASGTYGVTNT